MVLSNQIQLGSLQINRERLLSLLDGFHSHLNISEASFIPEMSEHNKHARDFFIAQAELLKLKIDIDAIGNIKATRNGTKDLPPVVIGGFLDSFSNTTPHSGALSLAIGLELIKVLEENKITIKRPISIVSFTNTQGRRFTPNLLGSLVYTQAVPLEEMLCVPSNDAPKITLGKDLKKKKYLGKVYYKYKPFHSFIELVTEAEIENHDNQIGLVEGTYGSYWTEYIITEKLGITEKEILNFLVHLKKKHKSLTATFENIFGKKHSFLLDLRHSHARELNKIQIEFDTFLEEKITPSVLKTIRKELVRLAPIPFEEGIVSTIDRLAKKMNLSLPTSLSYQPVNTQVMMAKNYSACMYISCCKKGHQSILNIENGAQLLLQTVLELTKN